MKKSKGMKRWLLNFIYNLWERARTFAKLASRNKEWEAYEFYYQLGKWLSQLHRKVDVNL